MFFLADIDPKTFWNAPNHSGELYAKIAIALLAAVAATVGMLYAPPQLRKWIVRLVTFGSGLFYVLFWLFPAPIDRQPTSAPRNAVESFSFWVSDSQLVVASLTNVIAGFLIGLGIYSLLRVHLGRIAKQQRDWAFSVVLVVSMFLMVFCGYADWIQHQDPKNFILADQKNWGLINYGRDLLFDGLLQNMDAGMFSIVAFYILSAAYRAFRARSVEATILLFTALLVILSLMGVVEFLWSGFIDKISPNSFAMHSFVQSFKLSAMSGWLRSNVQTPAIRGIDFGVGIGLLAMGLRLWLSLEKTGGES
jgi:tetrahydromethanopterin S-methyltransferase subunit B